MRRYTIESRVLPKRGRVIHGALEDATRAICGISVKLLVAPSDAYLSWQDPTTGCTTCQKTWGRIARMRGRLQRHGIIS